MDSPLQFARANVQRIVAAELPRSVRAKALAELIRYPRLHGVALMLQPIRSFPFPAG